MIANGATIIITNATPLFWYDSNASRGIPITKNRILFVTKPR